MAEVFFAKDATIKMGLQSNMLTIDTANPLSTFFGSAGTATAIHGKMKDCSITESTVDVDKIDLIGTDSNGFQNAEVEEKPASMVEISGTLVLDGDELIETFISDAGTVVTGGYTRWRGGKATQRKLTMLVQATDGTDTVNYAMVNGYPTVKETSLTGADGHFETKFTLKCLARDFFGPEFLN